MDRLQRLFGNLPGLPGQGGAGMDGPLVDTAEKVHISSLALLKMLKHGAFGRRLAVDYDEGAVGGDSGLMRDDGNEKAARACRWR